MTRGIEAFPLVFTQIVESLAETEEPFMHRCESNKEAQALRFKFYSFIKAVKRGFSPREKELAEILAGLTFLVQGATLVIERKDNLPEALSLSVSLSRFTKGAAPNHPSPGRPLVEGKNSFLLPKGLIEEIANVEDLVEDWFKGEV